MHGDFVYRPASTATHTVQFKRKYSLREGYKVFLKRLEQHNSELPPDEERIRKIGYAQYVEVMTGKGYSRLKPCQTGLCATCQDYGRENFEALKVWGTDVRKFCERIELALPEMFAEKCFNETVDKVRHYLRDTFRRSCSSEAECQCATGHSR